MARALWVAEPACGGGADGSRTPAALVLTWVDDHRLGQAAELPANGESACRGLVQALESGRQPSAACAAAGEVQKSWQLQC